MVGCYRIAYAQTAASDEPIYINPLQFTTAELAQVYIIGKYSRAERFAVVEAPWSEREEYRLALGHYAQPVWAGERFWREHYERHRLHFPHICQKDSRLLSYTADEAKGKRDIQTPIKPGRYLRQFFSDVLSEKQIAFYAEWHTTGEKPVQMGGVTLHFAHTPDEIEKVYVEGPQCCMGGDGWDYDAIHPARVYGAGDLAVAYLVRDSDERIIARAIAWPEKKAFGRVYPNDGNWEEDGFDSFEDSGRARDHLFNLLRKDGYTSIREDNKCLDGARLLKISLGRRDFVMPYVDNFGVRDEGEFFVLDSSKATAKNTNGSLHGFGDNDYVCRSCGNGQQGEPTTVYRYWSPEHGAQTPQDYCPGCVRNYSFVCDGTNERYTESYMTVQRTGGQYHTSWWEHNSFVSDRSYRRFPLDERVVLPNGEAWAASEVSAREGVAA